MKKAINFIASALSSPSTTPITTPLNSFPNTPAEYADMSENDIIEYNRIRSEQLIRMLSEAGFSNEAGNRNCVPRSITKINPSKN